MAKGRFYDNATGQWVVIDAKNADTLGGKPASDFATSDHNHDTSYPKKTDVYTKTESDDAYAKKANNLSDLPNKVTARTNLGLGSAATQDSTAFATSSHKHDSDYVKGNYTLVISGTGPTANATTMWWDTTNNLIKRHNGTAWIPLNGADAATLGGLSPGTGANNILKLNSNGQVPAANLPLASSTSNGAMTNTLFDKLTNIADNANNYVHPANHPASMILEDTNRRFVSDSQINQWNSAQPNQNTFANVLIQNNSGGSKGTLASENTQDTLIIKEGNGITLTPDTVNDAVTIAVPDSSTGQKGIVQLNNTTSSNSTTEAATANAVRVAYDFAGAANSAAATANSTANTANNTANDLKNKLSVKISVQSTEPASPSVGDLWFW